MNLDRQILFIVSALGAFNGLFLSLYFAFFLNKKRKANYFLSALLFVLSVRIIKSVFFFFNPSLSEVFIQIGLTALVLIGPFLYLYISMQATQSKMKFWWLHIFPALLIVVGLGILYPYWEYRPMWRQTIITWIYRQWLVYILITLYPLRHLLKKLFTKNEKLSSIEIWILSVFFGVTAIWVGYRIGSYTSYIVGALSFSVVFYLLVLFFFIRKSRGSLIFEAPIKYEKKKIETSTANTISEKLNAIMEEERPYTNAGLKIKDLADLLEVSTHQLSQLLNDNFGKNFTSYINEFRIEASKEMIISNETYTLEAIGYECGFNSKSTFFTTFKKLTGTTPAAYKKNHSSK